MSATWRRHWKIPLGMVVLAATLLLVAGQNVSLGTFNAHSFILPR